MEHRSPIEDAFATLSNCVRSQDHTPNCRFSSKESYQDTHILPCKGSCILTCRSPWNRAKVKEMVTNGILTKQEAISYGYDVTFRSEPL